MKNIYLLLISLFIPIILLSQNKIRFTYDNAGNRIERVINLEKSAKTNEKSYFEEKLSERSIRIYPNPTEGQFYLELSEFNDTDKGIIHIYGFNGQLIMERKVNSIRTDFDIRSHMNGIYIMQIDINGDKSTWKIIKK